MCLLTVCRHSVVRRLLE